MEQPTVPCPVPGCSAGPKSPRHRHPAELLNQLPDTCYCGAQEWWIYYGGVLPTMVACSSCSGMFNLGQRLRECGKPADRAIQRRQS